MLEIEEGSPNLPASEPTAPPPTRGRPAAPRRGLRVPLPPAPQHRGSLRPQPLAALADGRGGRGRPRSHPKARKGRGRVSVGGNSFSVQRSRQCCCRRLRLWVSLWADFAVSGLITQYIIFLVCSPMPFCQFSRYISDFFFYLGGEGGGGDYFRPRQHGNYMSGG